MAIVLLTGMSGAGKSTVLGELERGGHRCVDTDYGDWIDESGPERLWRAERIEALLAEHEHSGASLFIAGCVRNQRDFYSRIDEIVLLSAPIDVLLERVSRRDTNDFGKSAAQRNRIIEDTATVEPLLRCSATVEIDTRARIAAVVDRIVRRSAG